jgi:penicillin-binding protein 1C
MKKRRTWKFLLVMLLIILAGIYWFPSPDDPFDQPTSTVLLDSKGELLGARIAADGQWRFPPADRVPGKFETALIQFEDRHFHRHPGVNPFSLARALYQNFKARRIVSGGSTLTMQVIRLSRKGKPRTLAEKMLEMVLAIKLEMRHSKEDILAMYASNAPFGGNVVGLDAAAWRYFGVPASRLSWAEAAMLAVLPNAPALVHPGKNRDRLQEKRDRLLLRLLENDVMDSLTYRLSLREPIPATPVPLPQLAPHLLDRAAMSLPGRNIRSSVDRELQERVTEILTRYSNMFALNGVYNAAALVIKVNSGEVVAYAGNVPGSDHGNDVDIIPSLRSPGSLLKPVLFAAMMEDGSLLPNTLLPDVPTIISGYSPKNFNRYYDGAVPAKKALEKSLNVPAVRMLQDYRYERFYHLLQQLGISSLSRAPDHYGLSLILGGAEMSLWEICGLYASMARVLNHYYPYDGKYNKKDIHAPTFILPEEDESPEFFPHPPLSAGAIYLTFQSLLEVNRPEQEAGWEYFTSSRRIAWKTGTSFGFRDGWAVGTNPEYVAGVWVGNADGEGRPGLIGISTAAPVLFEIFDLLPESGWFDQPYDEMEWVATCRKSGHLATALCPEKDSIWILGPGLNTTPCPYHKLVHLNQTEEFRINTGCANSENIVAKPWFVLPPVMEWYYKMKDPSYRELPPFGPGCAPSQDIAMVQFIYPENGSQVFIPVELDGTPGDVIFEAVHRNMSGKIHWHMDDEYLGTTQYTHQMAVIPGIGNHRIKVVDENGFEDVVSFSVKGNMR